MSSKEVVLSGGAPWGFRIHGGSESNQPLRISRVNPGSRASLCGLREGDVITSINGHPTNSMTSAAARALMQNPGPLFKLGLNEDGKTFIRRKPSIQGEDFKESPSFNGASDDQITAHAPIYSTVKSPFTLALLQSSSKESTSIKKVPISIAASPKLHPSNPFYDKKPNQSSSSKSKVNSNLDRSKTDESPVSSHNADPISPDLLSNTATRNDIRSKPDYVNHLPNCKNDLRDHDNFSYHDDSQPFRNNINCASESYDITYSKHNLKKDQFSTSDDYVFEKYTNSIDKDKKSKSSQKSSKNYVKENVKQERSKDEHEFCETEEIKTIKKFVLSGRTSFELGDKRRNDTPESSNAVHISLNPFSSLSDTQLFPNKTMHPTHDKSIIQGPDTLRQKWASRDELHKNASQTDWSKQGAPKSSSAPAGPSTPLAIYNRKCLYQPVQGLFFFRA